MTITKRELVNRILKRAAINTVTSSITTDQENDIFTLLEDVMIGLSGNEACKIGYIKSSDPDYVDQDDESGIQDHDVRYVINYMIPEALGLMQMDINPLHQRNYHAAEVYLFPMPEPAERGSTPVPMGQGGGTLNNQQIYQNPPLDDEITLINDGELDLN